MIARPWAALQGIAIGAALIAAIHPYCRLLAALGRHHGLTP